MVERIDDLYVRRRHGGREFLNDPRRNVHIARAGQVNLSQCRAPLRLSRRVDRPQQCAIAVQVSPRIDIQISCDCHHCADARDPVGDQQCEHTTAAVTDQGDFRSG